MKKITIATRQSQLALWQANYVKTQIQQHHAIEVELLPITTKGDIIIDQPLSKIGGKGLFVKELEKALLDKRADIAVHSMKDVPMFLPDGLALPVVCEREDPRDVVVSRNNIPLNTLPKGSRVGTSSARRREMLRQHYPEFEYIDIRGNVNTRLRKLEEEKYDAIILAAAGLIRLEFTDKISEYLPTDYCIPSPGQGALGIECLADNDKLIKLLGALRHEKTQVLVTAERAVSRTLSGGCELPIAAYASLHGDVINLSAFIAMPDGSCVITCEQQGEYSKPDELGMAVAKALLRKGADKIIKLYRYEE